MTLQKNESASIWNSVLLISMSWALVSCGELPHSFFSYMQIAKPTLILNDGRDATNQVQVPIEIKGASELFSEMRVKITDSSCANLQGDSKWVPYQSKSQVQIACSPDGSQDGVKTVVVDLRRQAGAAEFVTIQGTVGFDTIAPKILAPAGILRTGLTSAVAVGQLKTLSWQVEDPRPSSLIQGGSDFSSGLDADAGTKISYTMSSYAADGTLTSPNCGESSTRDLSGGWVSSRTSSEIAWPSSSSGQVLRFCVFARDRAGNVSSLLSQPMSSPWSVVAGNENQGIGETYTGQNVHFNTPGALIRDRAGNLIIADSRFHNVKEITPSGTVVLLAGNGLDVVNGLKSGDALSTSMGGVGASLALDSHDRIYTLNGQMLLRIIRETDSSRSPRLEILTTIGSNNGYLNSLAIDQATDTVYISCVDCLPGKASKRGNYIVKTSVSALDSSSVPSGLGAPYEIYAGNGEALAPLDVPPNRLDASQSIDCPAKLVWSPEMGGLIYADVPKQENGIWISGHSQVRLIKVDETGVLRNDLLIDKASSQSMAVYSERVGEILRPALLMASGNDLLRFDLSTYQAGHPVLSEAGVSLFPNGAVQRINGVSVETRMGQVRGVTLSDSLNSVVKKYDSQFRLVETVGQPYSDYSNSYALSAFLNNPSGVTQVSGISSDHGIYFWEELKGVMNRIDPATGLMTRYLGVPYAARGTYDSTASSVVLNSVSFNARSATLAYHPGLKQILMAYGNQVVAVDPQSVAQPRVSTLQASQESLTVHDYRNFSIAWFAVSPASMAGALSDLLFYRVGSGAGWTDAYITRRDLVKESEKIEMGKGPLGPIDSALHALDTPIKIAGLDHSGGVAADSQGNLYMNGEATPLVKVEPNGKITTVSKKVGSSLVLVEESAGKVIHLFSLGANNLYHTVIDSTQAGTPREVVDQSCALRGTFLNHARQLSADEDGNLLIADTYNNRILRFTIRDSSTHSILAAPLMDCR